MRINIENFVYLEFIPKNSLAIYQQEEQQMTAFDPIAQAALNKAIDFLFDQAGKLLAERHEARQKRGDGDDSPAVQPETQVTNKQEVLSWQPKNVYLKDIPKEVKHHLDMIHQYRTNKRYTDATIAQFGGFNSAPLNVRNEAIIQEDQIKEWTQRLKILVEEVYGHKIIMVGLD